MATPQEMVSPLKVLWHRDKVADFLAGKAVLPGDPGTGS